MTDTSENQGPDLLYGAPAIADYLGLSDDAVYHLARQKRIPTFKMGRTVCARRSTLVRAIAELEAEAVAE
jgi:excisionase family DNA binding protein